MVAITVVAVVVEDCRTLTALTACRSSGRSFLVALGIRKMMSLTTASVCERTIRGELGARASHEGKHGIWVSNYQCP